MTPLFADTMTKNLSEDELVQLGNDLRAIEEILDKFKILQLDHSEYTCLKGVALFRASK